MRIVLRVMAGVLVLLSISPAGAQTPAPAVDVTAALLAATLKAAPGNVTSDLPIRVADVGGYNVGIYVVNRPKAVTAVSIFHETKVAEIYYMLKGAGMLVTGGRMQGPLAREAPGTTILSALNNVRGTTITGGERRRIAQGDVVVIPGYLPHWWSDVESDMSYLVIRPDPEKTLPLK